MSKVVIVAKIKIKEEEENAKEKQEIMDAYLEGAILEDGKLIINTENYFNNKYTIK